MAETYFLSSLDSTRFEVTRRCTVMTRVYFDTGKECLVVKVDIPVLRQDFNLAEDMDTLILTNRFEGEAFSINIKFPCFVFIARVLIQNIETKTGIDKGDVEIIGWGELYRTRHDADHHVFT